MKLNGDEVKQLQRALISAFPSESALEQMVRHQLGENLEVIAGGDNLSIIVFNLIAWTESQGKLQELVEGGCEENPNNPELKAFSGKLGCSSENFQPQKADSSTNKNIVQGNQNRVVQGNDNQSVLGDNNTVFQIYQDGKYNEDEKRQNEIKNLTNVLYEEFKDKQKKLSVMIPELAKIINMETCLNPTFMNKKIQIYNNTDIFFLCKKEIILLDNYLFNICNKLYILLEETENQRTSALQMSGDTKEIFEPLLKIITMAYSEIEVIIKILENTYNICDIN